MQSINIKIQQNEENIEEYIELKYTYNYRMARITSALGLVLFYSIIDEIL